MSGPAKRRRKNDYKPSSQPVRNLDYFFGKQRDAAQKKTLQHKLSSPAKAADKAHADSSAHTTRGTEQTLTDEELARKLHEEWNNEAVHSNDNKPSASRASPSPLHQSSTAATPNPTIAEPQTPDDPHPPTAPKLATASLEKASSRPKALAENPLARPKQTLSLQSTATGHDGATNQIPFSDSPLTFDPLDYVPDLQSHWARDGGGATYALLTRCFVLVNGTTSRIRIVDTLVNLLRTLIVCDPESLLPAVWLSTNAISPPYHPVELGVGGSALSKGLRAVFGLDANGLRTLYAKYGDAGDVAFEAKKRQTFTLRKPKPLTIRGVFESLLKIANSTGKGSQEVKQRIVERLMQDARGAEESRYIVRTLVQHLRIGAVKTTMLIALSRAFMLSRPPSATFPIHDPSSLLSLKKEELTGLYARSEEIIKACFARRPDYNDLVPTLLEIGVCDELLLRCGLALHVPLRPMLGSITRDMAEMLTKLQGRDFSCEFKYDGQRAQVHCDERGKVSIFSRHLENMTDKYPDLVALVPKIRGCSVRSFILEGEVVAIDRETGELRTFQTLANRARKDVVIGSVKIDVCLFAFDLMYLNGAELLDRPFRERRELLRSLFVEIPHHFTWAKSLDATSADVEAVQAFFKSATEAKCEGIMVKLLDNLPNPALQAEMDVDPDGDQSLQLQPPPPPTPKKAKKNGKAKSDASAQGNDSSAEMPKPSRRKALLSTYEPDKRLDSWLKVKKDYNTSADTLDLIPIAGWHGQGRKSKWWSPILLAVRDPDSGTLQAVTKCMSGFSDKFYKEMRAKYDPDVGADSDDDDDGGDGGNDDDEGSEDRGAEESKGAAGDGADGANNTLRSKPPFVEYTGHPDVWFEPQEVWECAFADVTLSPTYTASIGLVPGDRGLSLRFPRFLRVKADKGIEEASTNHFLADLWRKQEAKAPVNRGDGKGNGGDTGYVDGEWE